MNLWWLALELFEQVLSQTNCLDFRFEFNILMGNARKIQFLYIFNEKFVERLLLDKWQKQNESNKSKIKCVWSEPINLFLYHFHKLTLISKIDLFIIIS